MSSTKRPAFTCPAVPVPPISLIALDLYQNPLQPMVAIDSKIYYFAAVDDPYNLQPPMLACYDAVTGEAVNLCADVTCAHYGYSYATRCPLCDLTDYSRLLIYDGWLYYTRAERKATSENEIGAEYNMPVTGAATHDEIEVPYQLIGYNLTTGEKKVLYEVEAESYLDNACLYDGKIYFCETHYVERSNLVYERQDYDYMYFRDTVTDEFVKRRVDDFYLKSTERQNNIESIEASGRGYFSEAFLHDQRHNRSYKLEGDRLWEKIYTLARCDTVTGELKTLVAELPADPEEICVFGGMLFVSDAGACTRYTLDGSDTTKLIDYSALETHNASVSYLQYDQYTQNLYFLAKEVTEDGTVAEGGAIYYVKLYEDGARNAPTRLAVGDGDIVTGYQLASEGIYFTAVRVYADDADYVESPSSDIAYDVTPNSGSLYYIRWPDKTSYPVPYYTVYDAEENGLPVVMPTVIGGTIYACSDILAVPGYYQVYTLHAITMEVTLTETTVPETDEYGGEVPAAIYVANTLATIPRPKTGIETDGTGN